MTALESQNAVKIRGKVLQFFSSEPQPTELASLLGRVQKEMGDVTESDIRDVILRLLVSNKLMYMPDMRIALGKK